MTWWLQSGLTTTIAHDALLGGGGLLTNRMAAVNPLNIGNAAITQEEGAYWNVLSTGGVPFEYASAVTRPSSGAVVALVQTFEDVILQCTADNSAFLAYYLKNYNTWTDINGAFPVPAPAERAWQCVGLWWNASTLRYYFNNGWADVARSSAGLLPATLKGMKHPAALLKGRFAGMGVWSGAVTLALLQNIESQMRSELGSTGTFTVLAGSDNRALKSAGAQHLNGLAVKAGKDLTARVGVYFDGYGVISGVTTVENAPKARRVRLYDKVSGLLLRETFSNSVGQYEFNSLDPAREYFVVAHDHLRIYNAVVQDMLTP